MSDMDVTRIVEKKISDDKWIKVTFPELGINDVFRLFESTGEPVVDNDGCSMFKATSECIIVDTRNGQQTYSIEAINILSEEN